VFGSVIAGYARHGIALIERRIGKESQCVANVEAPPPMHSTDDDCQGFPFLPFITYGPFPFEMYRAAQSACRW
jgi:hypothetical protein